MAGDTKEVEVVTGWIGECTECKRRVYFKFGHMIIVEREPELKIGYRCERCPRGCRNHIDNEYTMQPLRDPAPDVIMAAFKLGGLEAIIAMLPERRIEQEPAHDAP